MPESPKIKHPENKTFVVHVVEKSSKPNGLTRQRKKMLSHRYAPVLLLGFLVTVISFATRITLLFHPNTQFDWTVPNIAGIFFLGLLYDLALFAYLMVPFVLLIWFTSERIYQHKMRRFVLLAFLALIALLLFTNLVPADFNKTLRKAVIAYAIFRCIVFCIMAVRNENFRQKWRTGVLYFNFILVIFFLLFNAVSEWFFWEEFSSRYNFIAVDYLVYTHEVAGNIVESYPLPIFLCGVVAFTAVIFLLIKPALKRSVAAPSSFQTRSVLGCGFLGITLLFHFFLSSTGKRFSQNEYANELAGNGMYEFGAAFRNNELAFYKFYQTLPEEEAFRLVRNDLLTPNSRFTGTELFSLEREVAYAQPEQHYNVVLISVESLSARFMKSFGGDKNITPFLDSLAAKGLFFTNLYASGTRTVRGLEALSLSIPPTPGQSIVKRPGNENLFSLGHVLRQKGYTTQYIYGGYGYFDNMNYFFGHNDYDVIDRKALKKEEIHYQNVWGVADEDLFTLAGRTLDSNYTLGKPFFTHIMTVSNHRPFTYPDGRIDIPSRSKKREGAVKYTDYAINRFLKESAAKPWFRNTIFVIVSDHCASVAGKAQLAVTGYHIPMVIYAPEIVKPAVFDCLTAQIDIAPTILGLLKMRYKTKFFGHDVLNLPIGRERAFISTYQGLGFLTTNNLIVQSPVKQVKQYQPDFSNGTATEVPVNDSLSRIAIAYYQVASWLLKNKGYEQPPH